ncbi:esterase [Pyrenophora tritici-repentis]|nr:esterase [Pyrenophora tritici-repentis]KAI1579431.1 esterase [Pyrenophora tritici-repentis]KAI1590797.1 esterase [Pyrenophora tritici-repentis]PWO31104.1 Dimer-Tnp-hAT domain containing protein [Pyrenophora tritici-repentis]PZD04029.1 esterase [Pyrenophora tritici-repentis]
MSFETTGTIASFGGKLLKLKHKSSSTNTDMELNMFLPPQALKSGAKVPVLFYLSGLTCTGNNCSEKGFFQHGAAQHGIAVVYPDTSPRGLQIEGEDDAYDFGSGAGFYVDATKEPWSKGYNMYSYITKELPEALFSSFKELDSSKVSITGHSMGGHGALTLFLKNPGMYKSVSAFAPIANPINCPWGQKAFKGYFGEDQQQKWKEHDATELVKQWKGPLEMLIDVGTGDNFYKQGQLLPENFVQAAKEAGNDKGIQLRMQPDYDHSYYFMATFADDHVASASKVENAIEIAANPTSSQELRGQAIEYLNQLRAEGSAWQAALTLFTRDPHATDFVRHTSLDLVNNAIQEHRLDEQSLGYIKDTLMSHIRQSYMPGSGAADTSHIQNKLMQTVTYLFVALYPSSWQSFFDDFRALAGDQATIGSVNMATTFLYLRMLVQVHDEIADQLVARPEDEKKRNTELKDLIRQRDAQKIALSWQEILAKWRETDLGLVEMCLRTIGRWVSWTDINLIVNQAMITTFLEMAGQQGIGDPESAAGKVRDAAIDTFSEIVGKKMSPSDKIGLITFLNLSEVVGQLITSPALAEFHSPNYDNDLAETVAKLVNNIVFDIVKILENESVEEHIRQRADDLIRIFTPYLLRFFADQYDEVCSTVIPSLTDLLTFLRKLQKKSGSIPPQYAAVLPPVLDAIIAKMKYDETATWGEEGDQTDEAEFLDLRRRLHVLQQTVTAIDEPYYIETLSRVVNGTFGRFAQGDQTLNWRDLELALYEMFLFGELAIRNQGLYAKREPSSAAAQQLVAMMNSMIDSGLANNPHPAIQLQYMEICVRYYQFFEQNPNLIPKVLENFVNLTHSNHVKVRSRSWYLFQRLVKHLRAQLGNVSYDIIQAVGDLLTIKAELPDTSEDEMSSDEEDQSADAIFNSQLFLFEAVGCIASSSTVSIENKKLYAQTIMSPLFTDMEQTLPQARNGDERAILQIHHIIMALGTLARGYSDWVPSNNNSAVPHSEVADEFVKASEAILVAVDSLNSSGSIRHAARFAFSRMIAVLGSRLLQQLPSWIEGLLSLSSSMDEISTFLKVLGQVIFTFKSEIAGILDTVMSPVLQRIFTALAVIPSGTDDEIQLAELRREYLNFIVVVLNHGLGSVLVSNDAQAKQVLYEAANLQHEIIKKVGESYIERLKTDLGGMGVGDDGVEQYLRTLAGSFEGPKKEKEWRNFYTQFVDRMLASRA